MDDESVRRMCMGIQRGNEAAFVALYDRWMPRAMATVTRWTRGDHTLAQDITQELFVRVIRSLPVLESEQAADAWMATTLRRLFIDEVRARIARTRAEAHTQPQEYETQVASDLASLREALDEHLTFVDDRDHAALRFRLVEGRTLLESSRGLGMTVAALHGRLRRAIKLLRARLLLGEKS
jgi:RNA polymerase sigma-70 factor, ECF subfamily